VILAFLDWQLWSNICGIEDRKFGYHPEQTIRTEIVNCRHPVTKGLTPWEMVDETYIMEEAGKENEILLTATHHKSMNTIAWTREYRKARVFCYQSGHDYRVYSDPNFRTIIRRAIL